MAAEVRVMTGTQGFQATRQDAEAYVAEHPEATIQDLRIHGASGRATERLANASAAPVVEPEPEPEPTPEPTPEPVPVPEPRRAPREAGGR